MMHPGKIAEHGQGRLETRRTGPALKPPDRIVEIAVDIIGMPCDAHGGGARESDTRIDVSANRISSSSRGIQSCISCQSTGRHIQMMPGATMANILSPHSKRQRRDTQCCCQSDRARQCASP